MVFPRRQLPQWELVAKPGTLLLIILSLVCEIVNMLYSIGGVSCNQTRFVHRCVYHGLFRNLIVLFHQLLYRLESGRFLCLISSREVCVFAVDTLSHVTDPLHNRTTHNPPCDVVVCCIVVCSTIRFRRWSPVLLESPFCSIQTECSIGFSLFTHIFGLIMLSSCHWQLHRAFIY